VFQAKAMSGKVKRLPKSRAEIQRAYRERKRAENEYEFKNKERQRWHKRRSDGSVKVVEDMTERQHRSMKRKWRTSSQLYRDKKKAAKRINLDSPPATPSDGNGDVEPSNNLRRGRKKVHKSRSKAYRMINNLKEQLENERRKKERYRKRLHRQRYKIVLGSAEKAAACSSSSSSGQVCMATASPCTPRAKTRKMLSLCGSVTPAVRKSLLLHNALIGEVNETMNQADSRNRMIASKVIRGNILKKYRLTNFARKSGLGISSKRMAANRLRTTTIQYERKQRKDATDDET
jgi:hypothetical protein